MQMPSARRRIKKLRKLAASKEVDLWAMDEVHFQQHGSRCRMWTPPECRDPVLRHAPTRRAAGYFGAVRIRDGKFVYRRESGVFNAETCWQFLRQLYRASQKGGRKIVVIADNARFHHATLHQQWRETKQDKFDLSFLPPYSPELNPIERVWKLTRRKAVHNRYFPTLNEVIQAVENEFERWTSPNTDLSRLCAIT
jgi:transposase